MLNTHISVFVFHIYKTLGYIIVLLFQQVYICGGFNGVDWHQTCEYYNPETDQWTEIEPMSSKRSGIGVIAYADHIYAVSVSHFLFPPHYTRFSRLPRS